MCARVIGLICDAEPFTSTELRRQHLGEEDNTWAKKTMGQSTVRWTQVSPAVETN